MTADLDDARVFAQVVELESFSALARKAGVPVSTVSRRVARLEARLGVPLLARTTRKLSLTDAGRIYLAHALRAIEELDAAESTVQALGTGPRGRVRITTPQGLARMLWPLVAEFLAQWPEVRVDLDARDRMVDLVEEGFDLAVRTGPLPDSSLVARKIAESTRQLFASAAYLERRGRPRKVADLATHECIVADLGSERVVWTLHQHGKVVRVPVHGRVRVNEMGLAVLACIDGCGIAQMPANVAKAFVQDGRVQRVLPQVDAGKTPVWLVHAGGRTPPQAVRAFAEHVATRLPALLPRDSPRARR